MNETFPAQKEIKKDEPQEKEEEKKRALQYDNKSLPSMNKDIKTNYDLPGEDFENLYNEPVLTKEGKENSVVAINLPVMYKNMAGDTLASAALRDLTPEERKVLEEINEKEEKTPEEKEIAYSVIATERYKPDSLWARIIAGPPEEDYVITPEMEAEQAAEAHKYLFPNGEEGENKEVLPPVQAVEALKKHVESQMSVFARARDLMLAFLEKHPKLAKLSILGTLAVELANATPAMANGEMERMIRMGVEGAERSVYTQTEGGYRAGHAQMSGQERAAITGMREQQRAQIQYQRDMQGAEQTRQNRYMQLDNNIMQWRSQSSQNQERIVGEIYARRMQIEQEYADRVANAQMRYRMTQQEAYIRQQEIQMDTQMRSREIQMQTQINQQRVMVNTGARVFGAAISGVVQHAFHH
ncbi:MAG: hypothetical protein WC878_07245 [Candidatus Paceibacterota bacterium]|jgi:hypothetical protein